MLRIYIKQLSFAIMCVPDQYKAKEMCDKVILGTGGMLTFIPDCYKNLKMCYEAVVDYRNYCNSSSIVI